MNKHDLQRIIHPSKLIKNVIYYEKTSSTNSIAKSILNNLRVSDNFLLISNFQTKGYGKNHVHFFSPANVGVYMSLVLLKPEYDLALISIATSLAILKTINHFISADVKLKYPNDILINGKKVCGILIESGTQANGTQIDYVIIGIGLNVNNNTFSKDIEKIATSMKKEGKKNLNRNLIIREILITLERLLLKEPNKLVQEYLINIEEKGFNNMIQNNNLYWLFNLLND